MKPKEVEGGGWGGGGGEGGRRGYSGNRLEEETERISKTKISSLCNHHN